VDRLLCFLVSSLLVRQIGCLDCDVVTNMSSGFMMYVALMLKGLVLV
jgi:hypothetical protein